MRPKKRDAVFRVIADPTRREILGLLLRGGRHTVGEIAGNFRTSRPAISKHLRLLRAAGVVVTRQEGTARICELNANPLRVVNDWLRDYEAFWAESLRSLKTYVEEENRWTGQAQATRSSKKSQSRLRRHGSLRR